MAGGYSKVFINQSSSRDQMKEHAPGIPDRHNKPELPKVDRPTKWEFVVHRHLAEKRGPHRDLRLGDPSTGQAHSWALPDTWPEPGGKTWAIHQPVHTMKYMDFEGHIGEGYGKGEVIKHQRDQIEITSSHPGHVSFNVYKGIGPEEYSLHRIHEDKWILHNRTIHRDKTKLPSDKPPYKEVKIDQAHKYIEDPNIIASAKIDDAH